MCLYSRLISIPFGILLLLLPVVATGAGRDEIAREEVASYSDYRFVMEQRVVHYDDEPNEMLKTEKMEAVLIVYKDDQEIYRSDEGYKFYHNKEYHPEIGTDITGDGSPDVVLVDWSGGAHCCDTYYIFELREPLHVMSFGLGDGGISFENLDDAPGLELKIGDDNFAYWRTSFVGSVFPHVILHYRDGQYVFAPDLTRQLAPSEKQLQKTLFALHKIKWNPAYLPKDFLQMTVDLIFTGNAMRALEFIESAWPKKLAGKNDFIAELFQCRLREDRWWSEIAQLNDLQPDEPLNDCGKRFPRHF